MSAGSDVPSSGGESPIRAAEAPRQHERTQWRQLGLITAVAVAIYFALRALPTGTSLSHMDFRVDPKGAQALEFCDPSNPQFIPVVAVRSPVAMSIATAKPARAGETAQCTLTLETASGKAIAPEDLLYTHTRKLHLLIVDDSLADYQHVHPTAGRPGEWAFAFTPHRNGGYRVFADFTPAATSRSLYASADLNVREGVAGSPAAASARREDATDGPQGEHATAHLTASAPTPAAALERDGYLVSLTPARATLRAGEPVDLALAISRVDGSRVALEPVMDALAHLVAFDQSRSGFAHLHPGQSELDSKAGPTRPVLHFKVTIPKAGRYVIWAQMNLAGQETFVPFWFDVAA